MQSRCQSALTPGGRQAFPDGQCQMRMVYFSCRKLLPGKGSPLKAEEEIKGQVTAPAPFHDFNGISTDPAAKVNAIMKDGSFPASPFLLAPSSNLFRAV